MVSVAISNFPSFAFVGVLLMWHSETSPWQSITKRSIRLPPLRYVNLAHLSHSLTIIYDRIIKHESRILYESSHQLDSATFAELPDWNKH